MMVALLTACGGGGGDDNSDTGSGAAPPDGTAAHISTQGFIESGLFVGALDGTEVLLLLQSPDYFLLAGEFASTGSYSISGVELAGSGIAYDVTGEDDPASGLVLRGEYKTDRHLQLVWQHPVTGAESSLVAEAAPLYFEEGSIENVLGAWINQDQSNLTFFSVSQNISPIAGDDFIAANPGTEIEVDVLANDRDDDGHQIFVSDVDEHSSRGGDVRLDDNGTPDDYADDRVLYTPPSNLTEGTDTFGYKIQDELEGDDDADVTITLPVREADVSVAMTATDEAPMAGDVVGVTVTVTNSGAVPVQVQVRLALPDGLVYRDDDGGASFDPDEGFWALLVPQGEARSLNVDLFVGNYGNFELDASISGVDADDVSSGDDEASITFVPGGLASEPPQVPETAQIEGVILSSLTQITGTIVEPAHGFNAYPLTLNLGAGGLGTGSGGTQDLFSGYVIISEELVEQSSDDSEDGADSGATDGTSGTDSGTGDNTTGGTTDNTNTGTTDNTTGGSEDTSGDGDAETELRATMLILTSNASGVYLNKLFYISEEELNDEN